MKNQIIILFTCFLTILSCSEAKDDLKLGTIDSILIAKGELYGSGEEDIGKQNLIIKDYLSLKELHVKMRSYNDNIYFNEEEVDFSKHIVIAIFDEVKMQGITSIDIYEVVETQNQIIVEYYSKFETGDLQVVNQPYHIVKIPNMSKPIVFRKIDI